MSKTILITGGAGFVAHHIVDTILRRTDWHVVSLDRLDYSGNLNRLHEVVSGYPPEVQKRVRVVWHDLKAEINPEIAKSIGAVDVIMHLAAASHVDRSILYPLSFVLDNVVGTTNILQFARNLDSLERFVYFSTDEVFGPAPLGVSYKENDRYNATNPYSATKAGGEEMAVAFQNTYGLPLFITHTMNVFGERQHPEKFIPLCMRKTLMGETVPIHADHDRKRAGSRHYIYASDVADALLFLLDYDVDSLPVEHGGVKCQKFNIVGEEELDNLELAQIVAGHVGKELVCELVDYHSSRPGHDLRYALSNEKMKAMGWMPKEPVRERLRQVISWTLANDRWLRI